MAKAKTNYSPSRAQLLIQSVLCLLIAYGLVTWAIDYGRLWIYGLALVAVIFAVRFGFQSATNSYGKKRR